MARWTATLAVVDDFDDRYHLDVDVKADEPAAAVNELLARVFEEAARPIRSLRLTRLEETG